MLSKVFVKTWASALVFALLISILVLAAFTYWFVIADRYIVFLYYHDMGPLVPDTSPFSRVTGSRYWMASLVASGAVLVLFGCVNWLLARFKRDYQPPYWLYVWLLCAVLLLPGILLITKTANQPTLPFSLALITACVALCGLALAIYAAGLVANRPVDMLWLAADGLGMALILILLANLTLIPGWLRDGAAWRLWLLALLMGFILLWLVLVTVLRFWRHTAMPPAAAVFLAGVVIAYLLLPLIHYLFATDGYFYISNSDNFFARTLPLQLLTWLLGFLLAWFITWVRK